MKGREHKPAVVVHPNDNVATSIRPLECGELLSVAGEQVEAMQDIPIFHKIAISDIPAQTAIVKFGATIGEAKNEIAKGSHVHLHNVASRRAKTSKLS